MQMGHGTGYGTGCDCELIHKSEQHFPIFCCMALQHAAMSRSVTIVHPYALPGSHSLRLLAKVSGDTNMTEDAGHCI